CVASLFRCAAALGSRQCPLYYGLFTTLIYLVCLFFFFNDTATTEIYTLSLHDALPISMVIQPRRRVNDLTKCGRPKKTNPRRRRSEEHTSELQSRENFVCRLLLDKKKTPPLIEDTLLHELGEARGGHLRVDAVEGRRQT